MELRDLIRDPAAWDALQAVTAQRQSLLDAKAFAALRDLLPRLPERAPRQCTFDTAEVVIGEDLAPDDPDRPLLEAAARAAMPWKKGPFRLFGIPIDAEWRSDLKWDRLAPHLPDQAGKVVLDVGCNNGYYLFRLAAQNPGLMLGIDPVARLHYQFHLLQRYARVPNLHFQMWGWEEVVHFDACIDTLFNMGILYHHRDPLGMLRALHRALKPGGLLVMETIIIPGEEDLCLFPADRYARMRNVWFVPTLSALRHMLTRAKFVDLHTVAVNRHLPEEQRSTAWNPGPSYEAFLDPHDATQTLEGYPAPHRAVVFARKKGHM